MKYECSKNGSTPFNGRLINYRKGGNDVPSGALDHVGSCKVVSQSTTDMIEEAFTEKYPGYEELVEAGYTSHAEVQAASDKELRAINGIGPVTLKEIRNQ